MKRIGVIGCGNISPQYFKGAKLYEEIEIVACADIDLTVARARAEEFGVPRAVSVDELLADAEIDIALNLTTPQFHAPINQRILQAGKHAYCEKPFATNREDGRAALELAKDKGLYIGCAPDTFLSGPLQTARKLIDEGFIGRPFGALAVFACPGHERWHPNPAFYYQAGGGPLLDMGPYYLTALANLFGPAVSVMSSAKKSFDKRTIGSEPRKGETITVETSTHYTSILEYGNGATASTLFSFDLQGAHDLPHIMIYGTEGNLALPDPNRFDGILKVSRAGKMDWEEVPLQHRYEGARALGLAEMAAAIESGRPQRASGELAYHVFDTMVGCDDSAQRGSRVEIQSSFERLPVMRSSDGAKPRF